MSTTADGDLPSDADLRVITDEQRAADAAAQRRREHWLLRQAGEAGTFEGVLVDLGEREQLLALSTTTGRVLRGVIRTIGADFVGLRAPSGEGALVPLAAITVARPEPGSRPSVGDRLVQVDTTLLGVLANLASERPWVSLHSLGGETIAGHLREVGRDQVVLRTSADLDAYVPVQAISDVALP